MAYAFRNATSQGNASGAGLTVTKPASTADGDLIIVVAYLETDANTWSSVGSGFNTDAGLLIANTGLFSIRLWWKWASGEPASWTWTPASNAWRTVLCASYSGGSGSGTAKDVTSGNQGDAQPATAQTAPSVTTTAANDLLVYGYGNFSSTNIVTMTGAAANLRVAFGGAAIADANIAGAGATGTSRPATGPANEDFAALHAAFFLSPAGGGGGATGFMTTNTGYWG